uniref:Uncharacterized protein n=1 Tax=Oncorhynchus tshawytscha TaxID=74940 RepID=A0AAZ3Q9W4_ONCTS
PRFSEKKCKDQSCELNYRSAAIPLPAASSTPAAQTLGWRQEAPRGAMSGRSYSSTDPKADHRTYLWARCNERKQLVHDKWTSGFDYDYTMAFYYNALNNMIYNTARLPHRYPEGIRLYYYIPNFTARGLHYDIQKIDAFHYIQLGTVGLNPVPDEVLRLCGATHHVPLHQFCYYGYRMKQFMNIFSIPEMTLLAVANDFFISNDIEYDPEHLIKDVSEAIGMVHIKGYMYKWIMQDLGEQCWILFVMSSQTTFLFYACKMDKGMRFMVGKDWRDFFDRVIVQADKPHFFNDCEVSMKPFRQTFGCCVLYDFLRLTGWRGSSVLYFGDCLYVTQKQVLRVVCKKLTKNLFNMASISCVLNYDLSYTFYPLCIPLQHEVPLWMDQIYSGCMKTPFLEEMAHIC